MRETASGGLPAPDGPGVVYGLFVPNAPNLIAPDEFGGVGADTVAALRGLAVAARVRPEVVLVSTPHFVTPGRFAVQASPTARCLHDFAGFPGLRRYRYEPTGSPDVARQLVEAGRRAGLPAETTTDWGLDHGAWAPLLHLLPRADVPVVPLSINDRPAEEHVAWGAAIARALRDSGQRAVIIGTGSILHRLDRANFGRAVVWPEGAALEAEVVRVVLRGGARALGTFDRAKWQALAPEGDLAPLFTVLGAMGEGFRGREVSTGQAFGAAGMTILEFTPASGARAP